MLLNTQKKLMQFGIVEKYCPFLFKLKGKNRRVSLKNIQLFILLNIGLLNSCVTISPATVELSSQVGDRITEMNKLHQVSIQRYFDSEEKKVEQFMSEEWTPLFLKNYLAESRVLAELDSASVIPLDTKNEIREALASYIIDENEVSSVTDTLIRRLTTSRSYESAQIEEVLKDYVEDNELPLATLHVNTLLGTDEPARIILEFAESAHEIIDSQRVSLMAPIWAARHEVLAEINTAYSELIKGQSIVTGRLEAERKKGELQTTFLNSLSSTNVFQDFKNRSVEISEKVNLAIKNALYELQKKKN